jgi:uncharacterized protein (TIGR02246 family)
MGPREIAEIQVHCIDLLNRYILAVHKKDTESFVNSFAPDGVWIRPGDQVMRGHDEIRDFIGAIFATERLTRHVLGGTVVDVQGPDRATVESLAVGYEAERLIDQRAILRPPSYIAEYSDEARLIDGRWRLQQRKTRVVFVSRHALPLAGIVPLAGDTDASSTSLKMEGAK